MSDHDQGSDVALRLEFRSARRIQVAQAERPGGPLAAHCDGPGGADAAAKPGQPESVRRSGDRDRRGVTGGLGRQQRPGLLSRSESLPVALASKSVPAVGPGAEPQSQ